MTHIHEACERAGFHVITEGTDDPGVVLSHLLDALRELDPTVVGDATVYDLPVPRDALLMEQHAWWSTLDAEAVMNTICGLLNRCAPPGFALHVEGDMRIGFFRVEELPAEARADYQRSTASSESLYPDGRPGGQRRFGDWRCPPTCAGATPER